MSNFGTELTYKFNTYIIRDQNEAALLAEDSFFSLAVLAALYLIQAGTNKLKKAELKKKIADIVISKQFDQKKFFRLLNFVRQLIKLTKPLEKDFEQHISQPKIQNVMQADKEFLTNYPVFFGEAVAEIQADAREKERETIIMNAHDTMGFSAEQIAKFAGFDVHYVESVIDKFEKKE